MLKIIMRTYCYVINTDISQKIKADTQVLFFEILPREDAKCSRELVSGEHEKILCAQSQETTSA